jgi:hypothetical protein
MLGRIYPIHTAAQNGNRATAGFHRRLMRDRIHAACQPAHHRDAVCPQVCGQFGSHLAPVRRDPARAHDGHRKIILRQQFTPHVEHRRRLVDIPQPPGIDFILTDDNLDAALFVTCQQAVQVHTFSQL